MAARKQSRKRKKKQSIRTTDPEQSARFLEMAKKLQADETGSLFERALSGVLRPVSKKKKR